MQNYFPREVRQVVKWKSGRIFKTEHVGFTWQLYGEEMKKPTLEDPIGYYSLSTTTPEYALLVWGVKRNERPTDCVTVKELLDELHRRA